MQERSRKMMPMVNHRLVHYRGDVRISAEEAKQPAPHVCPTCGTNTWGFHQCEACRNDPRLRQYARYEEASGNNG